MRRGCNTLTTLVCSNHSHIYKAVQKAQARSSSTSCLGFDGSRTQLTLSGKSAPGRFPLLKSLARLDQSLLCFQKLRHAKCRLSLTSDLCQSFTIHKFPSSLSICRALGLTGHPDHRAATLKCYKVQLFPWLHAVFDMTHVLMLFMTAEVVDILWWHHRDEDVRTTSQASTSDTYTD